MAWKDQKILAVNFLQHCLTWAFFVGKFNRVVKVWPICTVVVGMKTLAQNNFLECVKSKSFTLCSPQTLAQEQRQNGLKSNPANGVFASQKTNMVKLEEWC